MFAFFASNWVEAAKKFFTLAVFLAIKTLKRERGGGSKQENNSNDRHKVFLCGFLLVTVTAMIQIRRFYFAIDAMSVIKQQ